MTERRTDLAEQGAFTCNCRSVNLKQCLECIANRYFSVHVQTVVKAPTNAVRHNLVNGFERTHGFEYAEDIKRAAKAQLASVAA